MINKHNRDYYGGGLMLVLGVAAAVQGMRYQVGSLSRMGPGFFPMALGVILALIGVTLLINARNAEPAGEEKSLPPEWRGWICIILSLVAFAVLGTYGGLLPASFAVVFIAALGDRQNSVKAAFYLALSITAVSVVVFWWALQVQFPLFNWG
ncbi:tripartite tricarboxylate transporter TctB family protein [mine drainage metagenome]|uniref:Tripartite tricarboxylate transporter TctB family protein n=1 Tax=mine drainage metagenome TaxID=410659 RepID=A0A1J5PR29_9ZZZZ